MSIKYRVLVLGFALAAFAFPHTSSAQAASSAAGAIISPPLCIQLTHGLGVGSTDSATEGDVTRLQNALISTGYLSSGNATGYFGALTQAAVQKFQAAQGVVSSGTAASTGFGAVGPATRNAFANWCRGLPTPPIATSTPPKMPIVPKPPTIGTSTPPKTATSTASKAPFISTVSPAAGTTGTKVTLSGANLSPLTEVDLYWADGSQSGELATTIPSNSSNIVSANSKSITFTISGSIVGMDGAGGYTLKIVTPAGTSNAGYFTLRLPSTTPPSATIDPSSVSATADTAFTVSGTAQGVASVRVSIGRNNKNSFTSAPLTITKGKWSTRDPMGLPAGAYGIAILGYTDSAGTSPVSGVGEGGILVTGTLTVTAAKNGQASAFDANANLASAIAAFDSAAQTLEDGIHRFLGH